MVKALLLKIYNYFFQEIYDSLDAPVFVWEKIHQSDWDLSWLLVKRVPVNERLNKKLEKAWEKMYDEFITEFGFSDSFKSMLSKKIEIAKLKMRLAMTDDRSYETEIEIAELELSDLVKESSGANFGEAKIAIEKHLGFQLNMKKTSIREYYGYLNELR